MPKWIMLSMALALAGAGALALEGGGVDASMNDSAHAVDNTEMDVTMMEGVSEVMDEDMPMAPVPSIALSGTAKMGVKRVDDDSSTDPNSDRLQTVAEYEVTFGASGVTDGGLVFGAAISIDEDGKGKTGANGVNRPSVYIGAADGSWKLQFGDNVSGLDITKDAPFAIGVADADAISESTLTVVPVTYLDLDGSRKVFKAVRTYGSTISDKTTIGYVDQYEWGTSIPTQAGDVPQLTLSLTAEGNFATDDYVPVSYIKQLPGGVQYDLRRNRKNQRDIWVHGITGNATPMPAPPLSRTDAALTGTIGAVTYVLTAGDGGTDAWSAGGMVRLGRIDFALGTDSNKVRFLGLGGSLAGLDLTATYVRQDKAEIYDSWIQAGMNPEKTDGEGRGSIIAQPRTVNDRDAYGLSVGRQFGAGTTITLGWSRLRDRALTDAAGQFAGTKRWDLDITHDLGGGAELYASLQQERRTEFAGRYNIKTPVIQSGAANRKLPLSSVPVIDKSKVTMIELGVTMKF